MLTIGTKIKTKFKLTTAMFQNLVNPHFSLGLMQIGQRVEQELVLQLIADGTTDKVIWERKFSTKNADKSNCIFELDSSDLKDPLAGTFQLKNSKKTWVERQDNFYIETPFVYLDHYDSEYNPLPHREIIHAFRRGQKLTQTNIYVQPFADLSQYPDYDFGTFQSFFTLIFLMLRLLNLLGIKYRR